MRKAWRAPRPASGRSQARATAPELHRTSGCPPPPAAARAASRTPRRTRRAPARMNHAVTSGLHGTVVLLFTTHRSPVTRSETLCSVLCSANAQTCARCGRARLRCKGELPSRSSMWSCRRRTQASCCGSGGRSGFRAAGDGVPPRYLLSTHSATRLAALAAECACRCAQTQHSPTPQTTS